MDNVSNSAVSALPTQLLLSSLKLRAKESNALSMLQVLQTVQVCERQRAKIDKQYHIALRILKQAAGASTFEVENVRYQIRVRNGTPYLCTLEAGSKKAA